MNKVLVSDKLSDAGLEILGKADLQVDVKTGLPEDELVKIIPEYDALIIRSGTKVTAKIIEAAKGLRVIGRAGIGVDNIDLEAATKQGIIVMNTPTGNAVTTAEHAIAMMFAASRHIPAATASLKGGEWERKKFTGHQLCGKTLGIVGVGNIGKIVADRAQGLKMTVMGYDPFLTQDAADKLGIQLASLDEVFAHSDYISIHTPLTDKTRGLVNKGAFKKMKKGVILINCARGGIVSEDDLVWAINEGIVQSAALDVFEQEPPAPEHPLLQMKEVVVTPHLGAATDEAQENVAIEIAELIVDYLSNGAIRNAVNVPSVSAEMLKVLGPYLKLGEKLGSLQGQLSDAVPDEVQINYYGEISVQDVKPITISVLKGLLAPMLEGVNVNYVNALHVAQERGIKVVESKITHHSDFASLIEIALRWKGAERTISGTIFGHAHPRIVRINGFYLEAIPEGTMLYIHNEDKPGVIGDIGTFLGRSGINISRMQLGLSPHRPEATALYSIDAPLSDDLLAKLRDVPHILSVKQLEL